jgi:ABC-type sugar transport system permease subunit
MASIGNGYFANGAAADDGSGESNAVAEIISLTDLSWLFKNMQVGTELLEYVIGVVNDIYNIINRSGVQMLIFLAGLQSISPAIYESCQIDGATSWETFWKITFPMISPMILVNAIYTIIDSFTSESNVVMTFIQNLANDGSSGDVAVAMYWMYFLVVILILAAISGLISAYVFYQKRD